MTSLAGTDGEDSSVGGEVIEGGFTGGGRSCLGVAGLGGSRGLGDSIGLGVSMGLGGSGVFGSRDLGSRFAKAGGGVSRPFMPGIKATGVGL